MSTRSLGLFSKDNMRETPKPAPYSVDKPEKATGPE